MNTALGNFIQMSNHCQSEQDEFRMNEGDCRMKKLSLELRQRVSGSCRLAWATQQVANQLGMHSKKKKKKKSELRHRGCLLAVKGRQDTKVAWELRTAGKSDVP